ncbi:hypothetical protein RHGRI_008821 [Rhododendron griersonianum]|uniref:Uncharacterized protein n=1 Tax=Rhododendron griersonianum TaxID=479676 RepID=A0AAV6L205_9ERIC|nr:hypothetical protein RHGRI_008821 [Rhododendron griersonianum]
MASNLIKTLRARSSNLASNSRSLSGGTQVITSHTAKWMQDMSKKSPMELINEVPPIKVEGRIVACEGDNNPSLGHPIELIFALTWIRLLFASCGGRGPAEGPGRWPRCTN